MFTQGTFLLPLLTALGSHASPMLNKRDNFRVAIDRDFADPAIMLDPSGKYYAYASTDLNGHEVQVATSDDGFAWEFQEGVNALAYNANWTADPAITWAPDVWPADDGRYWMYYSAAKKDSGGLHCIGFAVSSDPMDFAPLSGVTYEEPWACDDELGLIDPSIFRDQDGELFVLYKVDGNSKGQPTPIMLQRVAQDGHTKVGDAIELLRNDETDGPLVEAPALVLKDGIYYLTFSSNWYNTDKYDVSYATATSVLGPYTKARDPDAPLLVTDGSTGLWGPGGADIVIASDGSGIMLYHGWNHPVVKNDKKENYRQMYAARVGFDNHVISLI